MVKRWEDAEWENGTRSFESAYESGSCIENKFSSVLRTEHVLLF